MKREEAKEKLSIKETVLERIQSGELTMRSRASMTTKIVILAFVATLAVIVSVFIFNFIFFSIRLNEHDSLLGFGPRGIWTFIAFFPWPLLALDIFLIAVAEWLLRQFRFGYQRPVLYLLLGLLGLTISIGLLIDRETSFNERMLSGAEHHRLPPGLGDFYAGARRPPGDGMCRCVISAIGTSTITAYDEHAGTTTVVTILLPPDKPMPLSTFKIGDVIFVAGDREDDTIRAFGINTNPPPPRR